MNAPIQMSAFKKKMRSRKFHAGSAACPTNCPPGFSGTMAQLAAQQGRNVAGAQGQCAEIILPLSGTIAIGDTSVVITETSSPVGICVNSIVAVQNEDTSPVLWSDLTIRNNPQWIMGMKYDEMLFAPDAECSCCLPGDCVDVGANVSVQATIPAALLAALPVALYLIGTTVR